MKEGIEDWKKNLAQRYSDMENDENKREGPKAKNPK